jgi:hypothetical protein
VRPILDAKDDHAFSAAPYVGLPQQLLRKIRLGRLTPRHRGDASERFLTCHGFVEALRNDHEPKNIDALRKILVARALYPVRAIKSYTYGKD